MPFDIALTPKRALVAALRQQQQQQPQAFGPPPTPHAQAPQQPGVKPQVRRPPLLAQEQIERGLIARARAQRPLLADEVIARAQAQPPLADEVIARAQARTR